MKKFISIFLICCIGTVMSSCIHNKDSVEGQCGGNDAVVGEGEQSLEPFLEDNTLGMSKEEGEACSD
ncbi:MAG: hypothetical protein D3923_15140 [Candidatus Electrothrix sp. AR3]|nr:hypothetical protein [Candidatus Electrothrix sp. AR3]